MPGSIRQRGQATVEYLYVLPILLILLLGALQFMFIYEAKQTLNYATFLGTRGGALDHGKMTSIQDGLASGMAPLFNHGLKQINLKEARAEIRDELAQSNLAKIEIISPTLTTLGSYSGEIPNDNLMYRSTEVEGDMNIQDANLLKVKVTYCVRLVVPIVNRMIYAFTAPATNGATVTQAKIDSNYHGESISASDIIAQPETSGGAGLCKAGSTDKYPYRIRVTSEAVVRMQSTFQDPGKWIAP